MKVEIKMKKEMFLIEVTDLFGGELNYSWVSRFLVHAKNETSAVSMVSRYKGYKVRKYCDGIYKSKKLCIGMCVEWVDSPPEFYEYIVLGKVFKMEKEIQPYVGMGCSLPRYSDIDSAHVVHVSPCGKIIYVTLDKATLLNGVKSGEPDALVFHRGGFSGRMTGTQRWKLEPQPDGQRIKFTLRKDGTWVQRGQPMGTGSQKLSFRHVHYHDFNF